MVLCFLEPGAVHETQGDPSSAWQGAHASRRHDSPGACRRTAQLRHSGLSRRLFTARALEMSSDLRMTQKRGNRLPDSTHQAVQPGQQPAPAGPTGGCWDRTAPSRPLFPLERENLVLANKNQRCKQTPTVQTLPPPVSVFDVPHGGGNERPQHRRGAAQSPALGRCCGVGGWFF